MKGLTWAFGAMSAASFKLGVSIARSLPASNNTHTETRAMKRITIAVLALVAAAQLSACMIFKRPPTDPKLYEPTQSGAAQLYTVTFTPAESIKVGRLHSWSVRVVDAKGAPVNDA